MKLGPLTEEIKQQLIDKYMDVYTKNMREHLDKNIELYYNILQVIPEDMDESFIKNAFDYVNKTYDQSLEDKYKALTKGFEKVSSSDVNKKVDELMEAFKIKEEDNSVGIDIDKITEAIKKLNKGE